MLKNFLSVMLTVVCVLQFSFCSAAGKFNEEINLPVGMIFRINADNLTLTILQGNACIERVNGVEQLHCTQVGDVLLNAHFTFPHDSLTYYDYKYLIHVLEPNDFATAEQRARQREAERKVTTDPGKFLQQVLVFVNAERAKVGLSSLKLSFELQQAAAIRAQEISKVYSHTRPNGSDFYTVLRSKWGVGENIAAGTSTPEDVMKCWMDSPGHRANILRKNYKELGVGYYYDENGVGGYKHYWVQIFRE